MDVATAKATLTAYLGGNVRPVLSEAILDSLVARFAIMDSDGLRPTDDGWGGSYALNAAAAEGWRMKAGMVAADFNFSADDASFSKGDVMAKMLEMEQHYASLDNGSLYLDEGPADYRSERLWV
jgi:hypothetical protein